MIFLQLLISSIILQATGATAQGYTNAYSQVMPLVIVALLLDSVIIVVWYYAGVAMNNAGVRASALNEFYQFIGTCIMIAIILATLVFVSSAYYNALGATKLMSPTAISTMCSGIESTSHFGVINQSGSLLSGPVTTSGTSQFPGICSLVGTGNGNTGDITSQIDYPLAASSVIVANLTNQTVANLNYSFTLDAFIGFLSQLRPQIDLCIGSPSRQSAECANPAIAEVTPPFFKGHVDFAPYGGYRMVFGGLGTLGALLSVSTLSFVIQLLMITIFIYIWPWLFFVGVLFRSTFLTRRIGGLMMAIALGGLIIFPLAFSFEYLTLGNGIQSGAMTTANPTGYNVTYGFNSITALPGANSQPGTSTPGNYIINFFVEPNIKGIAFYNSCWPTIINPTVTTVVTNIFSTGTGGKSTVGLFGAEAIDLGYLLVPLASTFSTAKYVYNLALSSQTPSFPLPVSCTPANLLNTFYQVMNAYGIIGITSFLLPLMNIIITISAILGLSGLFGGETNLVGLGKII